MYWARRSNPNILSLVCDYDTPLIATIDLNYVQSPAQHVRPRHRQQALVHQKRDDPRPEQILQGLQGDIGQDVEQARAQEQAVGDQGVQMGVEIHALAERVDGHDDAGLAVGQVQGGAQVFEQALVRKVTQVLEQVAVEAEVGTQHLGDTEGEMPVRDREQDRLG
jgi:hypothetical protein